MSEKFRRVRERIDRTFRGQLTAAGTLRPTYEAEIPGGTPLAKVTSPQYWFSQVAVLKPFDRIECTWDDGSCIAMLRVMGVDEKAGMVLVTSIDEKLFDAPDLPGGYTYDFVNKGLGWRILQADHKTPLRGGFASKMEAYLWLSGERSDVAADKAGADDDRAGQGEDKRRPPNKAAKSAPPAPPAEGAQAAAG